MQSEKKTYTQPVLRKQEKLVEVAEGTPNQPSRPAGTP